VRQDRARQGNGSEEHGLEDGPKVFVARLLDGAHHAEAGVIHEHIDGPEVRERRGDRALDLGWLGDAVQIELDPTDPGAKSIRGEGERRSWSSSGRVSSARDGRPGHPRLDRSPRRVDAGGTMSDAAWAAARRLPLTLGDCTVMSGTVRCTAAKWVNRLAR
jgi:hypothetical protein